MAEIKIKTDDITFEDKVARDFMIKLDSRIDTINKRTKNHTMEIRELKKMITNKEEKE